MFFELGNLLVESEIAMGGLQTIMDQFSSFTMAAEDVAAVAAVTTDYSSSQASEYSNYSLYGTLALVRHEP
jgi:hypothetical protein